MKKFIGLVLLALALISCNDDITNVYQQESSSSIESLVSSSSVAGLYSSSSSEIEVPISSEFIELSSSELLIESSSSLMIVSSSSIEYGALTDRRDGKTYKTVVIGSQTWMAENLNYAVDSSWCYNNSADSCTKYGRLYQWASAMDLNPAYDSTAWGGDDVNHQGICPEEWRLPNYDELQILNLYVEYHNGTENAGTSLKSTNGWSYFYGIATGTDHFGFSALPAGGRNGNGVFDLAGGTVHFWSSTKGKSLHLYSSSEDLYDGPLGDAINGGSGSIRCIKD